jgi:glucose/arabinose dehydrogenase
VSVRPLSLLLLAALAAGAFARPRTASSGDVALPDSATPPRATVACAPDNAGLTLPPGFCASLFADSLGAPRHMAVAANGDVFVQIAGGPRGATPPRGIAAIRDANKDGKADTIAWFGTPGGTGIALHAGYLYSDEKSRIVRFPLAAGRLVPSGDSQVVVDGLPTGGHPARNFVIDRAGNLFVNIGSRTNSCQAEDRKTGSMGVNPCVELETRAGIWKFDANKTGQQFSPAARYATGIRNAVGIALQGNQLFSTQHGRDQLYQNWGTMYDTPKSAENPAEELLLINQGDDFGWPYCYFDVDQKKLVLAPEYGGDGGKKVEQCAQKKTPVAFFPGHWAPNALLFYTGRSFPRKYRGGAFIAFHGSWNRGPEPQGGYNVVFQPMSGMRAAGAYEVFADGFAGPQKDPNNSVNRPTGLAVAPDGGLYISADKGGKIWKVVYTGR